MECDGGHGLGLGLAAPGLGLGLRHDWQARIGRGGVSCRAVCVHSNCSRCVIWQDASSSGAHDVYVCTYHRHNAWA